MKIRTVDGDYHVDWYGKYDDFASARSWCEIQFGDNWGYAYLGQLDRHFGSLNMFVFKRLYHAQWFVLKWDAA